MTKAIRSFDRRHFSGGTARIIMGKDEKALQRLCHVKRGEAAAPDLSGVLIVLRSYDEAMGHGIRARRSKSGAVGFDLVEIEASHASNQ